ncbi:hypothetical protein TYRP_007960 [Tyrophagus putrescentiae]|nr:hypothetical protein TYRP_007960 [Tyrophagus putrescentiae]
MARAYLTLELTLTVMLFTLVTNAILKEIDSKSDLLQEESMAIPAEHRAYPDMDMPHDLPNMLTRKNLPSKYEPSNNEVWPFARSESSQIKGLFIENTIIVQYDPQVQEIWDQARRLRCTWYDFYEKAVTFRPFNVDMLDAVTANFLGDNIQCWMQIQVGKGPWASEVAGIVKIGQTMTMVLAIKDEENKFDMLVRNCIAHDGKHPPIQLVDEYGCIVRSKVMGKFNKVKNFGHSASVVSYAYFQAFKFPDSMNVHFQCVIQVCRHECPQPTCDSDTSPDFLGNSRAESHLDGDKKFANRKGDLLPSSSSTRQSSSARSSSTIHTTTVASSLQSGQPNQTEPSYGISGTGGMPRALNLNKLRRRREVNKTDSQTDVSTEKVIQVVAPGDVAFNLPLANGNGGSGEVVQRRLHYDTGNVICMSTTGFAAGLVFLILLLLLTCIITVFLLIRLRNTLPSSSTVSKEHVVSLQCPNHPNSPCSCELSLLQPQYYLQVPAVHLANIS